MSYTLCGMSKCGMFSPVWPSHREWTRMMPRCPTRGRARGAGLGPRPPHCRRDARPHRPDDVEVLELAPAPARALFQVRQHDVDDAAMKSDQEHDAVGTLPRELDPLGPRGRH